QARKRWRWRRGYPRPDPRSFARHAATRMWKRRSTAYKRETAMPGRPYLYRAESSLPEHLPEPLRVVPPCSQAKHAEKMAHPMPGRRREVDRHDSPVWLEHPADLHQSPTLQFVGQVMQHQTAQHHVEALVRIGQGLDHGHVEAGAHAELGRL